jgi:hypothetical protein
MSDNTDDPIYALLVPAKNTELVDLREKDDTIVSSLMEEGAILPVAHVNLGKGQMCSFGIGAENNGKDLKHNTRAEKLLANWVDVYIQLHGPVIFSGLTAGEAVQLVGQAQPLTKKPR